MHGHVTMRYLQYSTVDLARSAFDNDECHVTAFRPISEAAHTTIYYFLCASDHKQPELLTTRPQNAP